MDIRSKDDLHTAISDLSDSLDLKYVLNRIVEVLAELSPEEPSPVFRVGDEVIVLDNCSTYKGKLGIVTSIWRSKYNIKIENSFIEFNESQLGLMKKATKTSAKESNPKFKVGDIVAFTSHIPTTLIYGKIKEILNTNAGYRGRTEHGEGFYFSEVDLQLIYRDEE